MKILNTAFAIFLLSPAISMAAPNLFCVSTIAPSPGSVQPQIRISIVHGTLTARAYDLHGAPQPAVNVVTSFSHDSQIAIFEARERREFSLNVNKINIDGNFYGNLDAHFGSNYWQFPVICVGRL